MTTSDRRVGARWFGARWGAALATLALALASWPSASWALSLGEARVLSALDTPLEAEIDIIDASADELAALVVEVPARDVFVRYGVARPAYLETARIAAGRGRDGRPVLQLRTRAKVTDPFLTVLVVADWGRGRVLREFNLVIDRRVLAPQPTVAPAAEIPQTEAARSAPIERAEATPDAPQPPAPAASTPAATASVRRGDTLLKFAREVARRDNVPVAQAAIALYEANPQAFGGSIHDLRAGVVLRLPSAEELSRLPRDRAQGEYAKQNATWRNRGGPVAAAPTNTGRLRLVAPTDAATSAASSNAKPADTETQPAPKPAAGEGGGKENANSSANNSSVNDERIAALERELAESTRLLELRSREIAALQAKVSDSSTSATTVDLSAALARLWWLWALLIGVVVGLVFELARRARLERERDLDIEPAPRGFAEAVREPTVSMPAPKVSPTPPPPSPAAPPPTAPAAPPLADLQEDLEGDPPPLDETGSRLDLARAYIEMGDPAAARVELEVVLREGDPQQRLQAQRLIETLRR